MGDEASKIICPHCGAENPKSLIVTTCLKCLGSLEGAQPAPTEPLAQAPAPEPPPVRPVHAPVAPPVRAPVMPPEPATHEEPVPDEEEPELPPARAPAEEPALPPPRLPAPPKSQPTAPPPRAPYYPPATSPPPRPPPADPTEQLQTFVRELRRSLRGWRGASARGRLDPKQRKAMLIAVAAVLFGVAVIMSTGGEPGPLLPLFVFGIGGVLAALVVRALMAAMTYEVTTDPPPSFVALGRTFTWGASIRAKKAFVLQAGRIVLRCQEHAVRRGKHTNHYRHTIYEQTYPIPPRQLGPGQAVDLRAEVAIPASAIPSYPGRNNSIEWSLSLEAPVEGICPDIKEKTEFPVAPMVEPGGDASADGNPSVPAKWLERAAARTRAGVVKDGPLSAMVWPADGQMPDALPVVGAGATREFNLTLQTSEDINCRGIRCWIGCRLHGRGTSEYAVLSKDVPVHQGVLRAGQTLNLPLSVQIPPTGPVTYAGRYVNFEWLIRVNLDIPLWWDRHVEVPFVVTPQLMQASKREPAPAGQASTPSAPPS